MLQRECRILQEALLLSMLDRLGNVRRQAKLAADAAGAADGGDTGVAPFRAPYRGEGAEGSWSTI